MYSDSSRVRLRGKTFELSIPHDEIVGCIDALAERINTDYGDGSRGIPLFVGVLNGAFMFFAELLQRLTFPCEVSFVRLSSYRGTASTGTVTEVLGLTEDIAGRHVVVVEDIVETGGSIGALTASLSAMGPASLEIAALLFKPAAYRLRLPIRYAAMELPNDFIVGFGLDYEGLGRNLRDIYKLADEG
ncbi:MAG TPA: hypoxanthine phosphoribosyltransferase [Candidatus Tidjanibacter gallistercoris]|nr:hypoxanthine phosphoribosyltransferase [Candidatus Tidjanibacter gallistercoris]